MSAVPEVPVLTLRAATADDLDAMGSILHESLLGAAETTGGFSRAHLRQRPEVVSRNRMEQALADPSSCVDVAEIAGGTVVGFVHWRMTLQLTEINMLYVDVHQQGHGTGTTLARHAIARSEAAGATAVRLFTMTWNTPSQRFYERLGFRRTGVEQPDTLFGTIDDHGNELPNPLVEYVLDLAGRVG